MERLPDPNVEMTKTSRRPFALLACAFAIAGQSAAFAQDGVKPKVPAITPDKSAESDIARYCANFAPLAAESRMAYQTKLLIALEAEVKKRISELETQEAEARDWVTKREALLKSANEDVVAIYAKMEPEAAAAQIGAMGDAAGAAILVKLNPRAAGGILGEMDAEKAARLTNLIAGQTDPEKKS
jgi:flagellar motility protein MotE (MotC chaperone)